MQLAAIRIVGVGPFEDLSFQLGGEGDRPRPSTVVLGGAGVGKTSLLAAIASTRPGHAVVQTRGGQTTGAFVIADWVLGDDDPGRPHPLRVTTPNASPVPSAPSTVDGESAVAIGARAPIKAVEEAANVARRREQALFDRRAAEGAGFVLVSLSGARWFSRAPILLASPERTLARYDVRAPASFDDATRADLARETKQVLAYAGIGAALGGSRAFDTAVRGALEPLLALAGYTYLGVDPRSLEPTFDPGRVTFDDLPTSVRHLVALAVLPIRALHGAYPAREDPRQAEGVVLVDDVERRLDPPVQRALVPALRAALPRVQWIVTTASPTITDGCDPTEVLALRRMDPSERVELYDGDLARLH